MMENTELIKALRTCADHNAVGDKCYGECPYNGNYNECVDQMILDAADALEAAEQRIADLGTALAACRARKGEQMPKDGEWIWDIDGMDWGIGSWKCKNCHARPNTYWQCDRTINPLTFAGSSYCPNCGARMRTVTDCHTLEESER